MARINNILSLFAVPSFHSSKTGKLVEKSNNFYGNFEFEDNSDLNIFLKKQNIELVSYKMTANDDITFIEIEGNTINQKTVNKIGSYSDTLESVIFDKVTTFSKNLSLEPLKVNELKFDNSDVPYTGEEQEFYIPKNILKTAKNVNKIAIYGFNISQRNINEIASLTKLTSLDFNDCTFDENMDYTNLKNLKNLTNLYLDTIFIKGEGERKLNELPESICKLKNLKKLISYRNDISSIPKCIKNLTNLEELDFNLNKLISIPKEINNLTNLKVLSLDGNKLETLPEEFGELTKLEELSLLGNKISTLPDEFGNLVSLKKLDLSYNLTGSIPDVIGKLTSLENLNLRNNKIFRIPFSIINLCNLKDLDLSDNKIKDVAVAILELKNLENLSLSDNFITEIPEAISELKNLTYFNLHGNDINADNVPEEVKNLPNLDIVFNY